MLVTLTFFIPVLVLFTVLFGFDVARPWIAPAVPGHPQITELLKAARRRILIALAVGIIAVIALVLLNGAYPNHRGIPLEMAPAAGGAAGLLTYAASLPRAPADPGHAHRPAWVSPQGPGSFLPNRILALALLMLAVQIAVLLFTGATASQDDLGRDRIFTIVYGTPDHWAIAGSAPYAGWFLGVPLLAATAIMVLATGAALWRVSSTPVLPEMAPLDAEWRRATNRILAGLASVVLAVQLHATALISGNSILNTPVIDGLPRRWTVAGWTLETIGGAAWVAALVLVVVSLRGIEHLPEQMGARIMPPPTSRTANSQAEARLEGGPSCS